MNSEGEVMCFDSPTEAARLGYTLQLSEMEAQLLKQCSKQEREEAFSVMSTGGSMKLMGGRLKFKF
jgi:hypothetical protein